MEIGQGDIYNQGDIYKTDLGGLEDPDSDGWHWVLIVQDDRYNHSNSLHVVACVLTSKLKRAGINGNVTLETYESKLPKRTVVNITRIVTVNKRDLIEKVGKLNGLKMNEVVRNIHRCLLRGKNP